MAVFHKLSFISLLLLEFMGFSIYMWGKSLWKRCSSLVYAIQISEANVLENVTLTHLLGCIIQCLWLNHIQPVCSVHII